MRLLIDRPDVYLDVDGPIPVREVAGGPAEVDTCAEGRRHAEIAGWVFERNICLAVPVRVVSVAAGLDRGLKRIVSPAVPSAVPLSGTLCRRRARVRGNFRPRNIREGAGLDPVATSKY